MRELWRRLVRSRLLALELLLTTAAVAVCTLASPLYVIQVLNRYVAFGFDGTLHALTAGMLLVTALLWGLRSLRGRLAAAVCLPEDLAHSRRAFDALLDAPCQAIAGPARARLAETPRQLALAEAGHDAGILLTLLDAPFSLLYLLIIFLLHPALGAICLLAALLLTATGVLTQRALGRMREEEGDLTAAQRRLFLAGVTQAEGLRMFGGAETLRRRAREGETRRAARRAGVLLRRQSQANALATVTLLAGTALYAVGAARVVGGDLTVGALIGASLLSQRVLANLAALAPALVLLGQAGQALEAVRRDLDIASSSRAAISAGESSSPGGVALRRHRGGLELRGLALRSPAGTLLFQRCDLRLAPGECLAVAGGPGAGKSTLARALLGLHPPDQGEILVDGVSLSQLAGSWWRRQVVYLPQDPDFLEGSLRETLLWANPALDQAGLEAAMAAVGLDGFVREHPAGFEHVIRDGGRSLPVDFRRRLALARALAVAGGRDGGGMLAVLDDPCLGLEESSRVLVHSLCRRLTASGRTLILCTNDPALMRLAGRVLRLDARPSPLLEPLAPGETGHAA